MDYYKFVEECKECEDLTNEDRQQLKQMLQSKPFKKLFKVLVDVTVERGDQLLGADLTTKEGVAKAIRTQGIAAGMDVALHIIMDEAEPKEDDNAARE